MKRGVVGAAMTERFRQYSRLAGRQGVNDFRGGPRDEAVPSGRQTDKAALAENRLLMHIL